MTATKRDAIQVYDSLLILHLSLHRRTEMAMKEGKEIVILTVWVGFSSKTGEIQSPLCANSSAGFIK